MGSGGELTGAAQEEVTGEPAEVAYVDQGYTGECSAPKRKLTE